MKRLTVAVFSYNRGDYLQNCLDSVRRNLPDAALRIYDDGSDDFHTRAVLAQNRDQLGTRSDMLRSKHGALYGNMQSALQDCETDFLMFLQDDMQIVREVTQEDVAAVDTLFRVDQDRAFVCPVFLKSTQAADIGTVLHPLPGLHAFGLAPSANDQTRMSRYAYADVSIAHVVRLRAKNWQFQNRERLSADMARQMFSDMPYLAAPFAFFCPEVPVFRQKAVTLAGRLAARISGEDVKAFIDMTPGDIARLRHADSDQPPLAEIYLTTVNPKVRRPFVFQDIKVRPWLAVLHRLELGLRKLWRSGERG